MANLLSIQKILERGAVQSTFSNELTGNGKDRKPKKYNDKTGLLKWEGK